MWKKWTYTKTKIKEIKHKQVNVRLSSETSEKWEKYATENGFSTLSSLVRFCTNEFVEGRMDRNLKKSSSETEKDNRINEIYTELEKIKSSQLDTLKLIAQKSDSGNDDGSIKLRAYQRQIILNLLKEKPRNEEELDNLFDDLQEHEIMTILNGLVEVNAVTLRDDGKFEMI